MTQIIRSTPTAELLACSVNEAGQKLFTLQLEYWRPIHSELMTHRMFSRNAGSSRARPVKLLIDDIMEAPWGPSYWGRNQSGMVAEEELDERMIEEAKSLWYGSAQLAAKQARIANSYGLHKQVVNRILEPYTSIRTIVTATEWDNFFKLRLAPDAQPEMRCLAEAMHDAIQKAEEHHVGTNKYHLPYISRMELEAYDIPTLMLVSAARCARISYTPFNEDKANVEKDLQLAHKLKSLGHMSPFEHQAVAEPDGWFANFHGWCSHRFAIEHNKEIF